MLFGYGNNVRNAVNDKSDRYIITCRNDYYAGAVIERNLFLAESASYVHNGNNLTADIDYALDIRRYAGYGGYGRHFNDFDDIRYFNAVYLLADIEGQYLSYFCILRIFLCVLHCFLSIQKFL